MKTYDTIQMLRRLAFGATLLTTTIPPHRTRN